MKKLNLKNAPKKKKPVALNISPRDFVDVCNKRDDETFDAMIAGIGARDGFGDFATMLGVESVIQQEERIVQLEPKSEELPNEIRRYVEMRKKIKKTLGLKFKAAYEAGRKSHNECARVNLDNSNGLLYCYVLPKFNDDGSHSPLGPRDFPWGQKKNGKSPRMLLVRSDR